MNRATPVLLAAVMAVFIPVAAASAPDRLSIEAELDRSEIEPVVEEALLRVTVRTTGLRGADPKMPRVSGLRIVPAGSTQNVTLLQGRIERSVTTVYRVSAYREGRYVIPPIHAQMTGARARTLELVLTVRKGGTPPASGFGSAPPGGVPPLLPEIFAGASVDRSQVYWNEGIALTVRLFSRVRLLEEPDWRPPEATGFWVEEVGTPVRYEMRQGGATYSVLEMRTMIYPTRAGRLRIGPARIRCRIGRTVAPPDPWSTLGLPEIVPDDLTLETKPIEVDVRALPAGAPSAFEGAVGDFRLRVGVDRTVARTGDVATITTRIEGEGNVASVKDPPVSVPEAGRSYEAGSSVRIDREGPRIRGERTRQVALVLERGGVWVVPPVRFSWFDPASGRYRTQHSDSIRIAVEGGPAARSAPSAPVAPAEGSPPRRSRPGASGSLSLNPPRGAVALGGASLLLYAGSFAAGHIGARRKRDPARARRLALRRLLEADLARARSLLEGGDTAGASRLALDALIGGIGIRYGIEIAGRPRAAILAEADGRDVGARDGPGLRGLLEELESAAFAPGTAETGRTRRHLDAAGATLERYVREVE